MERIRCGYQLSILEGLFMDINGLHWSESKHAFENRLQAQAGFDGEPE
jgi:hypothetical protein